jgi:hypothetical protein
MTGYGGTSKSGKHYHYYMCNNAKKHKCDKKAVPKEPIEDAVVDVCMSLLTEERIKFIAEELYKACQDNSNLVSIKRLEAALKETENAIENLWAALEHGQSVERITKRIDTREEEKKEIEKQLAIEKRKNTAFSYSQILAYLDYMRTIGRKNPAQRNILINTFVHSVYLYDDHLTIIFNGGKGQISVENIPFKKIEKSLKSGKVGTNFSSAVVTSVPANVRAEQSREGQDRSCFQFRYMPLPCRQTILTCLPKSMMIAVPTHARAVIKADTQFQQKEDATRKGCIL